MYLTFSFVNVSSSQLFLPLTSRPILLGISFVRWWEASAAWGWGSWFRLKRPRYNIPPALVPRHPPYRDVRLNVLHYGPGSRGKMHPRGGGKRGVSGGIFEPGFFGRGYRPAIGPAAPDLLPKLVCPVLSSPICNLQVELVEAINICHFVSRTPLWEPLSNIVLGLGRRFQSIR